MQGVDSTTKVGPGNGTSSLSGNGTMVLSLGAWNVSHSWTSTKANEASIHSSIGLPLHTATLTSGLWTNSTLSSGHTALNSTRLLAANATRPPIPINRTSLVHVPTAVNSTLPLRLNITSAFHNVTNTTSARPFPTPLYQNSPNNQSFADTTSAPYLNSTATLLSPNMTITTTKNACQQSFEDQQNSYFDFVPTSLTESLNTWILEYDNTTFSSEMYSCTKTCGTICYAGPVTTIISTTHVYSERIYTYQTYSRPFNPMPNCTIPYDECIELQSSYTSASDYYWTSMPLDEVGTGMPIQPYCSACKSTSCTFNQPYMELYYWPTSTTIARDYCATAPAQGWVSDYVPDMNHTYVPITTGTYAVVDGITMYQGNVYVSYGEPSVVDNCGHSVKRKNTKTRNLVVTLASDAIYSIRSYPHILAPWPVTWDLKPYSVNYDDFHDPVPWSAWNGMRECAQEGAPRYLCTPVKQASDYQPYMMMPPQIRDLDPAWKDCKFDFFAAYDPPIALQPANMFSSSTIVVANPTTAGGIEPEKTPATPGQNGEGWMPVNTARPTKPQSTPDWDNVREPVVAQPPYIPGPTPGPDANAPVDLPIQGITVGPSVMPVDSGGGLVIQPGFTLHPDGQSYSISNTVYRISSSSLVVIYSGETSTFRLPQTSFPESFVTVGPNTFPIDSSGNVLLQPGIPGITLTSAGNALYINSTMLSLGPSGLAFTYAGQTSTVPIPRRPSTQTALTIGTQTFPLASSGGLIIHPPITLHPSPLSTSQLILNGTTYILQSTALTIINMYGAQTYPFSPAAKQYITVGTHIYTYVNGKLVLSEGMTISGPGGMVVFAGTTIMVRSGGVVVGSGGGVSTVLEIGSRTGTGTETGTGGRGTLGGGTVKSGGMKMVGMGRIWVLLSMVVVWGLV